MPDFFDGKQMRTSYDEVKGKANGWAIIGPAPACEMKYWKLVNGKAEEMTAEEKADRDFSDYADKVEGFKGFIQIHLNIAVSNGYITQDKADRINAIVNE